MEVGAQDSQLEIVSREEGVITLWLMMMLMSFWGRRVMMRLRLEVKLFFGVKHYLAAFGRSFFLLSWWDGWIGGDGW